MYGCELPSNDGARASGFGGTRPFKPAYQVAKSKIGDDRRHWNALSPNRANQGVVHVNENYSLARLSSEDVGRIHRYFFQKFRGRNGNRRFRTNESITHLPESTHCGHSNMISRRSPSAINRLQGEAIYLQATWLRFSE